MLSMRAWLDSSTGTGSWSYGVWSAWGVLGCIAGKDGQS